MKFTDKMLKDTEIINTNSSIDFLYNILYIYTLKTIHNNCLKKWQRKCSPYQTAKQKKHLSTIKSVRSVKFCAG